MLSIAVLSSERAARPGRADKTATRHLSQAGSYQVTTARTGRLDATDAAPELGHRQVRSNDTQRGRFRRRSDPDPEHHARMFTVSSNSGTLRNRRSRQARRALRPPPRRRLRVCLDPLAGAPSLFPLACRPIHRSGAVEMKARLLPHGTAARARGRRWSQQRYRRRVRLRRATAARLQAQRRLRG